jgi:hypothetical protein
MVVRRTSPLQTMQTTTNYLELDDEALLVQCDVHTYRASGPGGQKRNKTVSAVRLRHRPTGLTVVGTESRSQHQNKARALRRLRQSIAVHLRRSVDAGQYAPSTLLRSCLTNQGRLQVGPRDARFLPAAGEVLDLIFACRGRVSDAARLVGTTTANLVDFLSGNGKVWGQTNEMRRAFGLKPLRQP